MFVISLHYKADINVIDHHLPAHRDWLQRYYDAGIFLASGRKVPQTGGVIIARQVTRDRLDEILAEDPFATNGLAEYEVIEFIARMTAPELNGALDEVAA